MSKTYIAMCCAGLLLAGCASGTTEPPTTRVTPQTTSFKAALEDVAKSGEIGSAGAELSSQFEALQKSDASKADAIKADFEKMMKSDGNPAAVKKLATDIAGKL